MGDDELVGEQLTMLMTLRMHARDALSTVPVLGDEYAAEVLERAGHPLREGFGVDGNLYAICARARLVDAQVRSFLDEHPDAVVLHLGCGLDSRVLRVERGPGVEWYDVDQAPVIARRREVYDDLPGVTLLAARVEDPGWWAQVPADRPRFVVAEGLLMYLTPEMLRTTLAHAVVGAGAFGLVADTVAPWVAVAAAVHPVMRSAGTGFASTTRDLTRAATDLGLRRRTPLPVAAEAARRTRGVTSLALRGFSLVPVLGSSSMLVDHYETGDEPR
ncbi:class I SAM-dependent methyltransferase [Marmoricola endophyticus]|uniref:class I SAM-dependent methyltransferase n=1 Tax=Marmoricola endophyticus TaxID=2040280 RepID=UPI00166F347A|nr:class I SAM-dependent methyltransferase [Marmoricola endophyticus]